MKKFFKIVCFMMLGVIPFITKSQDISEITLYINQVNKGFIQLTIFQAPDSSYNIGIKRKVGSGEIIGLGKFNDRKFEDTIQISHNDYDRIYKMFLNLPYTDIIDQTETYIFHEPKIYFLELRNFLTVYYLGVPEPYSETNSRHLQDFVIICESIINLSKVKLW